MKFRLINKRDRIFTKAFLNQARKLMVDEILKDDYFRDNTIQVVDKLDGHRKVIIHSSMSLDSIENLTKDNQMILQFASFILFEIKYHNLRYFYKLEAHPYHCVTTDEICTFPIKIYTLLNDYGVPGIAIELGVYVKEGSANES